MTSSMFHDCQANIWQMSERLITTESDFWEARRRRLLTRHCSLANCLACSDNDFDPCHKCHDVRSLPVYYTQEYNCMVSYVARHHGRLQTSDAVSTLLWCNIVQCFYEETALHNGSTEATTLFYIALWAAMAGYGIGRVQWPVDAESTSPWCMLFI